MLKIFFALLMCCALHAEESSQYDFRAAFTSDGEQFPLADIDGEPSSIVAGCVNVITGDFVDMQQDLVIPGSTPLTIDRSYSSSDSSKGNLAFSWHFNLGGMIAWTDGTHKKLGWKGPHGRELHFLNKKNSFDLDSEILKRGVTNNSSGMISGKSNLRNYHVKSYYPDKRSYTVVKGDGSECVFSYNKNYGPNDNLTREVKPNKMSVEYEYHTNSGYIKDIAIANPSHKSLQSIHFDYAKLKNKEKDLQLTLTASDGRFVRYTLQRFKREPINNVKRFHFYVKEVERPDLPNEKYAYEKVGNFERVVKKELSPNGFFVNVQYYTKGRYEKIKIDEQHPWFGRVRTIQSPIGSDANPQTAYRFEYHIPEKYKAGACTVWDAHNIKTDYCWDNEQRLTQVNRYNHQGHIYTQNGLYWGTRDLTGNLVSRIYSCNGEVLFCRTYKYDSCGNVIKEKLFGNLTGENHAPLIIDLKGKPAKNGIEKHSKSFTYSQDGKNLLLWEIDGTRKKNYVYLEQTDLLTAVYTYADDKIVLRQFYDYDEDRNVKEEITDDGSSYLKEDLSNATFRKIRQIASSKKIPWGVPETVDDYVLYLPGNFIVLEKREVNTYNNQGKIIRRDCYGSDGVCAFSLYWEYDDKGRLTKQTNPVGETIVRQYDAHNNLIFESGPNHDVHKRFFYDLANRLICKQDIHPEVVYSTHYRYNLLGQKIEEVDPFGNATTFEYDEFGRLGKTTFPPVINQHGETLSPFVLKAYDGMGNPTCKVDENGHITQTEYTIRGKPFRISYPDGSSECFTYYKHGPLKAKIERNGCKTIYRLDYQDRVVKTEFYAPDSSLLWTTSATYGVVNLLSETDALGHITTYSYDHYGRKVMTKKGDYVETYEYDVLGRMVTQLSYYSETEAVIKRYSYDLLNRKIAESVENSVGDVESLIHYAYDHDGHCIKTVTYGENGVAKVEEKRYNTHGIISEAIDPVGNVTRMHVIFDYYNSLGQKVFATQSVDPQGNVTLMVKNALGRDALYERKDPFGETLQLREFFYDLKGNLCKTVETVINPDRSRKQIITYSTYNAMDQVISNVEALTSPEQKTTRYQYNQSGQLVVIEKPSAQNIFHTYHPGGLLKSYVADGFAYEYEYDQAQRLISSFDGISGAGLQRVYDENDHLAEERLGDLRLKYSYDLLGRVVLLELPDSTFIQYFYEGSLLKKISRLSTSKEERYCHSYDVYDNSGNALKETLLLQTGELSRSFDLKDRLVGLKTEFTEESVPADGYDCLDNLLKKESRDPQGFLTKTFSYDALSQLTSETGHVSHTYLYDSVFNRCAKDQVEYALNDLNQILSDGTNEYVYDSDGNLMRRSSLQDMTEYSYDALGRLVSTTTNGHATTYVYDSFNRRISKTTDGKTIYFLYDDQNEIGAIENGCIVQLRVLGNGFGAEIGAAVAVEIKGAVFAPLHDLSGNIVALVNSNSQVAESYRYTAFGETTIFDGRGNTKNSSAIDNPWRFCSKRFDEETQFTYFGNRYYSCALGRWTTQDPLGHEDGPNLYSYVSNSPLTHFDLYGLLTDLELPKISYCDSFESYSHYAGGLLALNRLDFSGFKSRINGGGSSLLDLGRYEEPHMRMGFINGMGNNKQDALGTANNLSDIGGGYNFHLTHNASRGNGVDTIESMLNLRYIATTPVRLLHQEWNNFFENCPPDAMYLHICHSQGAIHTRNALLDYPDELRKRIFVVAVAPAAYIYTETCAKVFHYIAEAHRDGVPRIDLAGLQRVRHTVEVLPSHPDAPHMDHTILSPTYKNKLATHISNYLSSGGKSI
ncbi:Uncharacterized protein PHSC3_000694 [Chlamydiales bacterium STE3]|nr:Uncharacterized protein PHSC3_000694 [Chlamydiales bacterium STE3]